MVLERELENYINGEAFQKFLNCGGTVRPIELKPLAQGEYNANYTFTHPATGDELVLRVNLGSQMHLTHQIEYEANALRLIEQSGRTPVLQFTDGSDIAPGNGVLVMSKLPGKSLDYLNTLNMRGAAQCLADIHSVKIDRSKTVSGNPCDIPADTFSLIAPESSMKAILEECEQMLRVYIDSALPPDEKKVRLRKLLDDAWRLIPEREHVPYRCCINTELNSTNFLCEGDSVMLVDWEKPLFGDPAQDLGHFLAPTTTFWKTDVIFDTETTEGFIDRYIACVDGRFDTNGLKKRSLAYIPVTCLRGMTWCAMAWVQYRSADKELLNESTRIKLDQYLDDDFISDIEKRVRAAAESL